MADNNSSLQDDELYLPRTVVNKLIKEIVPNIRVATDARDLLLNCCTEFIHLLASEASDISEKQLKKVISPEHVVEALTTLGFQEYIPDVKAVHKEYKEQASKHRKRGKSKLDRLGIPEEELARQQQQLFDEARQQQMESELLDQQKYLQSGQQDSSTVKPLPIVSGSGPLPLAPHQTATVTPPAPQAAATNAVGDHVSTNERNSANQETRLSPSSAADGVPQNAVITAALQATSTLLHQALTMASAQAATGQPEISQQDTVHMSAATSKLSAAALQAALAAQKRSQPQPPSAPPPEETRRQASMITAAPSLQPTSTQVSSGKAQGDSEAPVATSQDLTVAKMMVTLAQASNCSTSNENSSLTQNPP